MSSAIVITDGSPVSKPICTHPIPTEGVSRVIKKVNIAPLEVTEEAIVRSAKHFMVVEPTKLGDVRHAAYFGTGKNLVPDVVDNKDFLGSIEILKYGESREMFCRAMTFEFDENAKLKKPEKADAAHCWSFNDVTMAKIAENYTEGVYTLDESDRAVFDAFFALDDEQKRLDITMEEGDDLPEGFVISTAFLGLLDSTSTLGRYHGAETKRKMENEKRDSRLFEAEKRAKWVDSVTFTKTGQVTLHLNLVDGNGKQQIVTATPLE